MHRKGGREEEEGRGKRKKRVGCDSKRKVDKRIAQEKDMGAFLGRKEKEKKGEECGILFGMMGCAR